MNGPLQEQVFEEQSKRQINQNFGTVCHTEVCLTFSRLVAKLLELISKLEARA